MSDVDWKNLKKKKKQRVSFASGWTSVSTIMLPKRQIPTLWKNLEDMYKIKNALAKIFLLQKLMHLKLKEG